MSIFSRVTIQTMKRNRTRTLVTIVGIILSAAMFTAVTTFIASLQNYMREVVVYGDGDWYGMLDGLTQEELAAFREEPGIVQSAACETVGYAELENSTNAYKPYLCVWGADDTFLQTMPVHLLTGRMPENSSEIILPQHLRANGGVACKVGDVITLELGDRIYSGETLYQDSQLMAEDTETGTQRLETFYAREKRTYTVVGIYERPSFEAYSAPGYTAITLREGAGQHCSVFFKTANPKDIYSCIEKYTESGAWGWGLNSDLLLYSGASRHASFYTVLYGLAAILIGLIMFGSVSLIYNAFAISVSERTRQFGLLSSVGATKWQLRRSVLFEALAVSAIGIPLGLAAGVAGIGVTLALVGDVFASMSAGEIPLSLHVSWPALVIAAAIAVLTVLISAWIPSRRATRITAIEAIRQSGDVAARAKAVKTGRLTYKLFGLEGMIAKKHFKRSRKKYRATVVSLFMSIVLFVSASSFCRYLSDSVSGGFSTYDFDLRYGLDTAEMTDSQGIERFQMLASVKDVKESAYTGTAHIHAVLDAADLGESFLEYCGQTQPYSYQELGQGTITLNCKVHFIQDEVYLQFLQENGMDPAVYMDSTNPTALVYDSQMGYIPQSDSYMNYNVLRNEDVSLRIPQLKEMEGYICPESGDFFYNENGEKCYYYYPDSPTDGGNETMEVPAAEAETGSNAVRIGAVIGDYPFCVAPSSSDMLTILFPYSAAGQVAGIPQSSYMECFFTASDHAAAFADMEKLLLEQGADTSALTDYAAYAEMDRNLVMIVNVFSYGFIVLISLIAVANVFNTISTNINLRRREFAMLKSVGMTQGGFNKMMNYECLLYGFKSLLLGLPAAVGVTWLIYRTINGGYRVAFYMPWQPVVIAVLSVFAVVFATMMYAMRKIKKDNPIDALKNENL